MSILGERPMKMNCLFLVFLLPAVSGADEVYLKGGGKVSGRVVQRTATSVEVDVGAGKITVPANRVERIEERRSALDDYYDRAGRLDATDAAGWQALGRWASDQGLSSQAREAYARVLAVAPNDPEANRALGRVPVDGRWMTEEEGYRARGFVELEGEWMTPVERDAILRSRAAEAEADRQRLESEARVRAAEDRAREAEARAAEAEAAAAEQAQDGIPLWWGWGPGPVLWPTQPISGPSWVTPRPSPRD
jgi:hypothetical protein